jgi:hypothetical protein
MKNSTEITVSLAHTHKVIFELLSQCRFSKIQHTLSHIIITKPDKIIINSQPNITAT